MTTRFFQPINLFSKRSEFSQFHFPRTSAPLREKTSNSNRGSSGSTHPIQVAHDLQQTYFLERRYFL